MARRQFIRKLATACAFVCVGAPLACAAGGRRTGADRLLGRWQSDAERTLAHWHFRERVAPDAWPRLEGLFGKLVLEFSRTTVTATLGESRFRSRYRVLGSTDTSITLAYRNEGEPVLETLYLGEDFFFKRVPQSANFEYFKRVAA